MAVPTGEPGSRPVGAGPAADRAESGGPQLSDCLDSFFVRQTAVPAPCPPQTSSTALLDQLPEVEVTLRGRGLVEILRPAYEELARGGASGCRRDGGQLGE